MLVGSGSYGFTEWGNGDVALWMDIVSLFLSRGADPTVDLDILLRPGPHKEWAKKVIGTMQMSKPWSSRLLRKIYG